MLQSSSDTAATYAVNPADHAYARRAMPQKGRLARICSLWPFPVAAVATVLVSDESRAIRHADLDGDDAGPSSFIT
jgi:hypothetical protein